LTDLPVVADAGPLIALARTDLLHLLRQLYGKVLIPAQVEEELQVSGDRPGSRALLAALDEGWIEVAPFVEEVGLISLSLALGTGEAGAILLAEQRACRFLLVDERRARAVARTRGLRIAGTGGVLLATKRVGLLERVAEALDRLAGAGYRLSVHLQREILLLAGEDDPELSGSEGEARARPG
jgi:predicted nucleic acid-binding protein